MKKCYKCGETKGFDLFSKCKRNSDGLQSSCKSCASVASRAWVLANPNKEKERGRRWRTQNPEKHRAGVYRWRDNNRKRYNEIISVSKKKHSPTHQAITAKRRSSKLQATPSWAELDLIKTVYSKAKELGSHVDHIVPLKSKTVCGLHCWANLQILPPETNTSKGNREWPDMP